MKKKTWIIIAIVVVVLIAAGLLIWKLTAPKQATAPATTDEIADTMTSADGKYELAFVTDVGQLKDKSFNEGTWNGVKQVAAAKGVSYKY